MAVVLDFQVAGRVDFINIPMGITVPSLVLVSQFARFFSYALHCIRPMHFLWWPINPVN